MAEAEPVASPGARLDSANAVRARNNQPRGWRELVRLSGGLGGAGRHAVIGVIAGGHQGCRIGGSSSNIVHWRIAKQIFEHLLGLFRGTVVV